MVVVYNPQSTNAKNMQPTIPFENPQPGDVLIWHCNPRPLHLHEIVAGFLESLIRHWNVQHLKRRVILFMAYAMLYGIDDDRSAAIWVSWSVLTFSGFISNSSHKILNLIWHVLAMFEIAVKSLPRNPNKREQVLGAEAEVIGFAVP